MPPAAMRTWSDAELSLDEAVGKLAEDEPEAEQKAEQEQVRRAVIEIFERRYSQRSLKDRHDHRYADHDHGTSNRLVVSEYPLAAPCGASIERNPQRLEPVKLQDDDMGDCRNDDRRGQPRKADRLDPQASCVHDAFDDSDAAPPWSNDLPARVNCPSRVLRVSYARKRAHAQPPSSRF